jgi:hypothetical protein
MGILNVDRGSDERSDALRTRRDVIGTYLSHKSPQVILTGVTIIAVVRLLVGSASWGDLVVVGLTILLTGFVEWFLHLVLLHAPEDSKRMTKFGTGSGHREHHLDPLNVGWIMLGPQDAFIFLLLLMGWTAAWSLPLIALIGVPFVATYLTALLAAYLTLAHYEWVHLLVHTRYRARSRYYRRLAANHRLHHYRNEHYWLGVTSNLGDRMLRTLPADKSDVALSDTARTL